MADPVVGKVGAAVVRNLGVEGNPAIEKQGPSKFDAVKEQAAAGKAEAAKLPPAIEQVPEADKQQIVSEVRQRIESNPAANPREVYGPEVARQGERIGALRKRVEQLPRSEFGGSVTARLDQIDAQFRQAGGMLEKISSMNDPRSLLQLQMQLYQVSQNIELVSKAVEQVNSGVKQVLQTQL